MNRGLLEGLKALPFIPRWMGGSDPVNDGSVLIADSTQEGGAKLSNVLPRRVSSGIAPSIAAANGTSSLAVLGNDEAHNVAVSVPGGNTADAAIATLTFNKTYGLYVPTFGLTPKNGATASAQPFVMTDSATGYQIGLHNPPASVPTGTIVFRTGSYASGGFAVASGGSAFPSTITIPAAVQVGDLMVLVCATRNSGSFGPTATPAGWTQAVAPYVYHSGNYTITVYTKIAVSGDTGGSITVTVNSWYMASCSFLAYSGAALLPNAVVGNNGSTGTTLTNATITPTTSGTVLLSCFMAGWGSGTTQAINSYPATNRGTQAFSNGTFSDSIALAISENAGPASGTPTGTSTATSNNSSEWVTVNYLISPYVAPPTAMLFDVLVTGR